MTDRPQPPPTELVRGRTMLGQPVDRLLAIAGVVVVGAIVLGVGLLVPTLARIDKTMGLIEQSLPVLQAVEPQVDRIARDVETITPSIGSLESGMDGVGGGVSDLDARLAEVADPLTRLELRIEALGERLGTLEELPAMRRGLDDTNATLGGVRGDLGTLSSTLTEVRDEFVATRGGIDGMAGSLEALVADFDRVVALLEETVHHIERLDRKTGPAVLPELGD